MERWYLTGARTALALAVGAALAGCTVVCKGPGCEESYPEGRLSVLDLSEPAQLDAWADAEQTFDGGDRLGSGWSVAAVPELVLVGMPGATPRPRVQALSGAALDRAVHWIGDPGSEFGAAVYAREVADRGAFDLWVGAPGFDYGRGAVSLFRAAGPDRAEQRADLTVVSATPNDRFGERIVECADLTGDRVPELVVTAPYFSEPAGWPFTELGPVPELAGAVFLILSESVQQALDAQLVSLAPWEAVGEDDDGGIRRLARVWWGSQIGEGAGTAVVCDRDLTGDGIEDLVIGSPWRVDSSTGRPGGGQIQLLSGGPELPPSGRLGSDPVDTTTVLGPVGEHELFGISLATLGGAPPLLVIGASGFEGDLGRVHVVSGDQLDDGGTPEDLAELLAPSRRADLPTHFGRWLTHGDLDGDGLDDLVVGAPDYKGESQNAFDTGRIWVWYGATRDAWGIGTSADDADATVAGTEPFQRIGRAMITADLDEDGVDALLVPTREASPPPRQAP